MKIQKIQIEQQLAKIQIESQRASLKVQQGTRGMQVHSEPAKMSVEQEAGYVDIDMQNLLDNTARKDVLTLQRSFAKQSIADARKGIQQIARDGNFCAQQPNGGASMIGELARQKMLSKSAPSTDRSIVPQAPVNMTGHAGDISVDWTPHSFEIEWDGVQMPKFSVEPEASVDVEIVQKPMLDISVVEVSIPPEPGQNIDTTA